MLRGVFAAAAAAAVALGATGASAAPRRLGHGSAARSGRARTTLTGGVQTTQPPGVHDVDAAGLAFVRGSEAFRALPYDDNPGGRRTNCTIGYGHVIAYNARCDSRNPAVRRRVDRFRHGITRAEALRLQHQDARRFIDAINRRVTGPLDQNEFNALFSFLYNFGAGGLDQRNCPGLLAALDAGDRVRAAGIIRHCLGRAARDPRLRRGLQNRRNREADLLLGVTSPLRCARPRRRPRRAAPEPDCFGRLPTPVRRTGGETVSGTVLWPLQLSVGSEFYVAPDGRNFGNGVGHVFVFADPSGPSMVVGNDGASSGSDPTSYPAGTQVTLTAAPDEGYRFDGWTGDCAPRGMNPTCILTMNAGHTATADFTVQAYTLTVTNSVPADGIVVDDVPWGSGIVCGTLGTQVGTTCSAQEPAARASDHGTQIRLRATANTSANGHGPYFGSFGANDCTTSDSSPSQGDCWFDMTGDRTVSVSWTGG